MNFINDALSGCICINILRIGLQKHKQNKIIFEIFKFNKILSWVKHIVVDCVVFDECVVHNDVRICAARFAFENRQIYEREWNCELNWNEMESFLRIQYGIYKSLLIQSVVYESTDNTPPTTTVKPPTENRQRKRKQMNKYCCLAESEKDFVYSVCHLIDTKKNRRLNEL